jgi:hypothetical protein
LTKNIGDYGILKIDFHSPFKNDNLYRVVYWKSYIKTGKVRHIGNLESCEEYLNKRGIK